MDRMTRAKIDSLLYEVRSWEPGTVRFGVEELARRYHLDPLVVRRLVEAEIGRPIDPEPGREAPERHSRPTVEIPAMKGPDDRK